MIRTSAPIAPPATAGAGTEDLLLELTWSETPVVEFVSLLVGRLGVGVSTLDGLEVVRVTVREVSVGCNEGVVEGGSDKEVKDEAGGLDCV